MAVVLLAAVLRLWQIGRIPPGFQFDEAYNATDAVHILAGNAAVFFPENGGREPFLIYLHAIFLALFGHDHPAFALRLASAFVGLVTVAALYRWMGELSGDRRVGLWAAAFLAVSYWHLHFSRYGIRAILAPLLTAGALWAWWRATEEIATLARSRRQASALAPWRWSIACGVFMALAVYSHPTGRLIPLILLVHTLYRTVASSPKARASWRVLAVAGACAFILFLPLGWFFVTHPDLFVAHPSDVSLQGVADRQFGGSLLAALAANVGAVLGMFFWQGDPSTFHNLPRLPVFDPVSGLMAVLGAGVLGGALLARGGQAAQRRDRAVLMVVWLGVMLVPTVFSDRPPNYSRAIAALPVIVLLPALGARFVATRLGLSAWVARGMAVGVIAVASVWTGVHYFKDFAGLPELYISYDVDKVDAFHRLEALAESAHVYLAPVWAEHATIRYLNDAAGGPIRMLDARETLVLPGDGQDVVVAVPAKESKKEKWTEAIEELSGGAATREDLKDAHGETFLHAFLLHPAALGDLEPPKNAPLEPEIWASALFGGAIKLLGYTPGQAKPGEPLPITLVWRILEPVSRDWTLSVKLVGPKGEGWGQQDREPGWASYPTSRWVPGEVVIDRYLPELAADADGMVTVTVGWYDRETKDPIHVDVRDDFVFRLKPIEVTR